mmetsp:Transcript_26695/g.49902  ORF Transcript_26695/g.49902 Transcript_26695/m.49902 type:complete len:209 (+) Transcript_26695:652-1278(+)
MKPIHVHGGSTVTKGLFGSLHRRWLDGDRRNRYTGCRRLPRSHATGIVYPPILTGRRCLADTIPTGCQHGGVDAIEGIPFIDISLCLFGVGDIQALHPTEKVGNVVTRRCILVLQSSTTSSLRQERPFLLLFFCLWSESHGWLGNTATQRNHPFIMLLVVVPSEHTTSLFVSLLLLLLLLLLPLFMETQGLSDISQGLGPINHGRFGD